jgi:hypothetical protein
MGMTGWRGGRRGADGGDGLMGGTVPGAGFMEDGLWG